MYAAGAPLFGAPDDTTMESVLRYGMGSVYGTAFAELS